MSHIKEVTSLLREIDALVQSKSKMRRNVDDIELWQPLMNVDYYQVNGEHQLVDFLAELNAAYYAFLSSTYIKTERFGKILAKIKEIITLVIEHDAYSPLAKLKGNVLPW